MAKLVMAQRGVREEELVSGVQGLFRGLGLGV